MYALYYAISAKLDDNWWETTKHAVIGTTREAAEWVADEELSSHEEATISNIAYAQFDDYDEALVFLAGVWHDVSEDFSREALKDERTRRRFERRVDFAF